MSQNLFESAAARDLGGKPLAERLRPRTLDEIVGQDAIVGEGRALRRLIERGDIPSLLLWGPPGSGKTTLARVLAQHIEAHFEMVSAVMSGVKELRQIVERATERRAYHRRRTVLFIDEIHRFNKVQQDALLPHVESGLLTLVGATTENPSFEVNAALLSRCRVFVLKSLEDEALVQILEGALQNEGRGLGKLKVQAPTEHLKAIAIASQGDARRALGTLEVACDLAQSKDATDEPLALTEELIEEAVQHKALLYDRAGDEHYHVVSAFIKSLRGSDADAAAYWLTRMLEAGEDPRFVLRRLVIFASEDIGNADPQALMVATAALTAYEFVGMPEGALPLTQAVTYLACAPKSNTVLTTYATTRRDVQEHGALPVPLKLRNAATQFNKRLGYGKEYKYPHNFEGNYVPESYLPDKLENTRYHEPSEHGHEHAMAQRLADLRKPPS